MSGIANMSATKTAVRRIAVPTARAIDATAGRRFAPMAEGPARDTRRRRFERGTRRRLGGSLTGLCYRGHIVVAVASLLDAVQSLGDGSHDGHLKPTLLCCSEHQTRILGGEREAE